MHFDFYMIFGSSCTLLFSFTYYRSSMLAETSYHGSIEEVLEWMNFTVMIPVFFIVAGIDSLDLRLVTQWLITLVVFVIAVVWYIQLHWVSTMPWRRSCMLGDTCIDLRQVCLSSAFQLAVFLLKCLGCYMMGRPFAIIHPHYSTSDRVSPIDALVDISTAIYATPASTPTNQTETRLETIVDIHANRPYSVGTQCDIANHLGNDLATSPARDQRFDMVTEELAKLQTQLYVLTADLSSERELSEGLSQRLLHSPDSGHCDAMVPCIYCGRARCGQTIPAGVAVDDNDALQKDSPNGGSAREPTLTLHEVADEGSRRPESTTGKSGFRCWVFV